MLELTDEGYETIAIRISGVGEPVIKEIDLFRVETEMVELPAEDFNGNLIKYVGNLIGNPVSQRLALQFFYGVLERVKAIKKNDPYFGSADKASSTASPAGHSSVSDLPTA